MKYLPFIILALVAPMMLACEWASGASETDSVAAEVDTFIADSLTSGTLFADSLTSDTLFVDSLTSGTLPADSGFHSGPLTEQDFIDAAQELGTDPAAIHAVVEIEAGKQHKGFWKEGYPLINFDLSIFRTMARRHGINLSKYSKSHAVVFARPDKAKYGSHLAAQQARFDAALTIDTVSAIEGTFWGMFQIGGFNWKKCGSDSPQDFARSMARSEREQLELFIKFLQSTGLDRHLRNHNWRAFARGYNGPSYARRGYHTRLADAYTKHLK